MGQRLFAAPPQYTRAPRYVREDVPVWFLRGACYFQERFLIPGTVINAVNPKMQPNLEMFPLNKLAYDKYAAFLKEYDIGGDIWAKSEKKAYTPKYPAFLAEWKNLNLAARREGISLAQAVGRPTPIMVKPPQEPMFEVAAAKFETNVAMDIGEPVFEPQDTTPVKVTPAAQAAKVDPALQNKKEDPTI